MRASKIPEAHNSSANSWFRPVRLVIARSWATEIPNNCSPTMPKRAIPATFVGLARRCNSDRTMAMLVTMAQSRALRISALNTP
jgi:hypothetical protein